MKKLHSLFILALMLIALPVTVFTIQQQQDNRSKAASVTAEKTVQPGGSISSAINAANAGDVITVAPGTYNEALNISKSGSAGNYITIQAAPGGKVITNGTLKISGDYIKLIGITVKGSSGLGAEVNGANNIVLQNFEIDGSQDGGLVILSSSNIVVDGCNIHGTNARGTSANHEALSITEATTNFEIKNCQVHDNGEEGIDAKYNGSGNANGLIHDNVVFNNRGPNIYIDGAHGIKVYNNISYGAKEGSKAGIAIAAETSYTGANNPRTAGNIDIFNNVIYNNAGGGISFWTEPGGSISNVRIYNNTIDEAKPLAIATAPGGTNPVFNNIFTRSASGGGLQMGNNLTGAGGFVGGTDYHLTAGSPAIDKGTAAGAPAFDKDNKSRPAGSGIDMGAYEFGSTGGSNPSTGPQPTVPQSPAPSGVTPTIYCVGGIGAPPCASLSPTTPVAPTGGSGSITPGTTLPPVGGTNPTTNPTVAPCPTDASASIQHNNKGKKKYKNNNGGGFLEQFFRFLFKLIEWFFGRTGTPIPGNPNPGGPIPCPEPTTSKTPTSAPQPTTMQPTTDPIGNITPTIFNEPTIQQPITPATQPSTPGGSVPVGSTVVFTGNYDTGNFSQWDACQLKGVHISSGSCAATGNYSLSLVNDGASHPTAARYELRANEAGNGQRAEVLQDDAASVVEGDERWYEWSMKFDQSFQNPNGVWFIVMQWHSGSGSPPLAINISNSGNVEIGGDGVTHTKKTIGPVRKGQWVKYVMHVKFSRNASIGYVEAWENGIKTVQKYNRSTMSSGENYLKQGIYRDTSNKSTSIIYHDDLRVTAP